MVMGVPLVRDAAIGQDRWLRRTHGREPTVQSAYGRMGAVSSETLPT